MDNRLLRIFGEIGYEFAHKKVSELAYQYWEESGRQENDNVRCWLRAEDHICASQSGDPEEIAKRDYTKYGYFHPCGCMGRHREQVENIRIEIDNHIASKTGKPINKDVYR